MENKTFNVPTDSNKHDYAGKSRDHAGVYIPPPMLYVATFFLSVGLQRIAPISSGWIDRNGVHIFGWVMLAASALFIFPAIRQFVISRNTLITIKPAQSLQTTGIYAFTRNPMYLGLLCVYTAIAFIKGNSWTFLMIIPLALLVQTYVIRKEEHYLRRAFGSEYEQYKNKVRRWI